MGNWTVQSVLVFFQQYGYPMMFIGSFVEGLNVMLLGGFFAARGHFNIWIVIAMMFIGDVTSDLMWYVIGYYGGNRIGRKFGRFFGIGKKMDRMQRYLEEKGGRIIVPIKFTTGLCLAMLITAGTVRMKFKEFFKYDIIGSALWAFFACGVGYFFGESFNMLSDSLPKAGLIITIFVIISLMLPKIIHKIVLRIGGLKKAKS